MKSSLKTFLAGKNGHILGKKINGIHSRCLKNSTPLSLFCKDLTAEDDSFWIDDQRSAFCCIDVLDDGTAITYCIYD